MLKIPAKTQSGFTLIELAIVIAVLGILAAFAIPRFLDLTTQATEAVKEATVGSVQSALAIYVARYGDYPTISELASNVQLTDGTATAAVAGVQVDINGTTYTVNTFTDDTCSTRTAQTSDTVKCVQGTS